MTTATSTNTFTSPPPTFSFLPRALRPLARFSHQLLFNYAYFKYLFSLVLLGELILGVLIIQRVKYTEIDWIAYMEEVGGFLSGEWDYSQLKGQTGPLVYPAGFVYLYSALYYITEYGKNILLAQYIFLALYLAFTAVVMKIYEMARLCPPYILLLLCLSRRIHSIFMLRCFNDCFAMFFLYLSIYYLMKNRYVMGCVIFSLALSIKMNILLFMPALGILLLQRYGVWRTIPFLTLIVAIQVILAAPFLYENPKNYFNCAFQFDREFFYIWTVNLKVLSEEVFLSKSVAKGLLLGHVAVMVVFLNKMLDNGLLSFTRIQLVRLFSFTSELIPLKRNQPSNGYILILMFIMNYIGIVFARSLHYQFYVWYYHTLPILLYVTPLPNIVSLILLAGIEFAWNVFPATEVSSGVLIACHLVLLVSLLISRRLPAAPVTSTAGADPTTGTTSKKVR